MSAKVIALPSANRLVADPSALEDDERTTLAELRRARIRIAQLEASLTEAMRDSLANFNRARDAERMLAEAGS
ncbi:MAG: hypothetical protein AAGD13_06890 [Pseudomonadota bacterium]